MVFSHQAMAQAAEYVGDAHQKGLHNPKL